MAEPIGVYSLPPGVHKNYKAIISKLNHGVDEQLIAEVTIATLYGTFAQKRSEYLPKLCGTEATWRVD